MVQSPGPRPGYQRTPLHPDEAVRAERNFTPYVAEALTVHGRFRVSTDSPDMVELFQQAAGVEPGPLQGHVGDQLGRPVVSVANGREITITFATREALH